MARYCEESRRETQSQEFQKRVDDITSNRKSRYETRIISDSDLADNNCDDRQLLFGDGDLAVLYFYAVPVDEHANLLELYNSFNEYVDDAGWYEKYCE